MFCTNWIACSLINAEQQYLAPHLSSTPLSPLPPPLPVPLFSPPFSSYVLPLFSSPHLSSFPSYLTFSLPHLSSHLSPPLSSPHPLHSHSSFLPQIVNHSPSAVLSSPQLGRLSRRALAHLLENPLHITSEVVLLQAILRWWAAGEEEEEEE